MKKKTFNKKLNLKKETVASLSCSEMNNVLGGYIAPDPTNTAVGCSYVGIPCETLYRCNC